MVFSCQLLSDRTLHETRQRRQYIDRWVNLPVVQLSVHKNLPLSNVTGQVWNRVRNIYEKAKSVRQKAIVR